MPTGYTACVQDGATFKEFATKCASAFFRDGEVSKKAVIDSYSAHCLPKAKKRLATLKAMSEAEAEQYGAGIKADRIKSRIEAAERCRLYRQRYTAMIAEVKRWKCPHAELKKFMFEQLQTSIEFDCHEESNDKELVKLQALKPMDIYYEDLQQAIKDIAWHEENLKKEEAANSQRKAWIDALNTALEGIE